MLIMKISNRKHATHSGTKNENSDIREKNKANRFLTLAANVIFFYNLPNKKRMARDFRAMAMAIALAAMIVFVPLALITPSWAAGSNTASLATPPVTPTPVVTSSPALSSAGGGGCAQQYTGAINAANGNALIANDVGLAANTVGAAATLTMCP